MNTTTGPAGPSTLDQIALGITVAAAVLTGLFSIWLWADDTSSFAKSAQSLFTWVLMIGGVAMGLLYLRRVIAGRTAKG